MVSAIGLGCMGMSETTRNPSQVVAVLVGYGLSIFAERKSWGRRKEEQVRDRQLNALLSFLATASGGIQASKRVLTAFDEAYDEITKLDTGSFGVAARETKRAA